VVVNSFHDARQIPISHQSTLIDWPTLYTFHGAISSTQGFTIGSSLWDESTRNRRRAAGTALLRPAIRSYYDIFDLEIYDLILDIYADGKGGKELEIRLYI
jgi:phenylacetate 2-hydroxylase